MPPQERWHEGVRVLGGLIRCAGRPQEWSCGAVPPQERWHEGVRVLGVLIRCAGRPREWSCGAVPLQERWHEGVRVLGVLIRCAGRTTGVVIRRRATSGEMARGVGVCFLVWGILSHAQEWTARGVRRVWGIVSHARERRHPALRRGRRGSWVFAAARGVCVFWFLPARMVLGVHFRQALRRHVGVDLRGGNAGMPQHQLHRAQVRAVIQ